MEVFISMLEYRNLYIDVCLTNAMSLKSQYRMERKEQVKKLFIENPSWSEKELILNSMSKFGFSERLVKEYLKLIKFEVLNGIQKTS